MAKRKVFISYRREDAAGFSHAVYDRLVENLSKIECLWMCSVLNPGEILRKSWNRQSVSVMF
jgi:hypothetical protein